MRIHKVKGTPWNRQPDSIDTLGTVVHLVADGLWTAPLEKDLFDAAGTGHPKTLRPLQFGFRVHRFGAAAQEQWGYVSLDLFPAQLPCHLTAGLDYMYLLLASESSLSKMERRAWAPMLRGRVCDLTNSRRLSPTCPNDLSLLPLPSLQGRSAHMIRECKTHFSCPKACLRPFTCHAAISQSSSQT